MPVSRGRLSYETVVRQTHYPARASPLGGEWKKVKSSEILDNGMYFNETVLRN